MARRSRRRPDPPGPSGFLVVDKPVGWTSHDVVDAARRWLGVRRVGHLGTLDPLATGALPLAVREATRLAPFLPEGRKVYVGTIRLGVTTDSQDAEGRVVARHDGPLPDERSVREALGRFVGEIEQLPPMYSSVKKDGEPLYKRARRGEEVERTPRRVRIHAIEMHHYAPPEVGIEVVCAPGTYVRTLAHDLGQALGCGAHLSGLRRTESGPFTLARAERPEVYEALAEEGRLEERLVAPEEALGLPVVELSPVQARRVAHGGDVPVADARGPFERGEPPRPGQRLSGLAPSGRLLAVLELRPDRRLHPLRVLPG
ncbi:MAG: tRNA pseudouridine(55) synthase TruB [Myxococcota bacterium]|nr:tRNA pseudouridine(55) synthase TruB [Myxococcota bacterium]